MDVILFKKDLDHFSDHDILTIAKMYNFSGSVQDLRWLIAINHSQKAQLLSGGIMSFSEKLPQLQKVAKERNDTSFPFIDSSFIDNLLQLVIDQRQFKKDLKNMTIEEKQAIEKGLNEKEKDLKNQPGWDQVQELREKFNVKQQYFDWVIKSYLSGSINKIEDISSRLNPAIDDFEWLKKNNKIDRKIKLDRLDGLKGLEDFLDRYEKDLRERRGELSDVEKGRQGGELIYDGKDIKIINPTTEEGACYYGRGTRWCTAATRSENMFEEYNKEGPLYIIQPKNPGRGGREKYQLQFETNSFMDEKDEAVKLTAIYEKYPEIMVLREHTPQLLKHFVEGDDLEKLLLLTKDNPITDEEASAFFGSKFKEKIFNYLIDKFNLQNITVNNEETLDLITRKNMLDRVGTLSLEGVEISNNIIQKLKNLRVLKLKRVGIEELPESIGLLSNLQILDLYDNKLIKLPDFIAKLKNLKILSVNFNNIKQLPDWIGDLKNLQELYITSNKISEIPDSIGEWSNLQKLDLGNNQISEIPDSIGRLSNLQELELSENQISEVPDSIGNLKNLTFLNLSFNELIENIPSSIGRLSKLVKLELDENQIKMLPDRIGDLKNLTLLSIGDNELDKLPDSIGNLSNLRELHLDTNHLTKLPDSMGKLKNLVILHLHKNKIRELPNWINELSNLDELYLDKNNIRKLPKSIGGLISRDNGRYFRQ